MRVYTKAQLKTLWGSFLYNKLHPWIDKYGYITGYWTAIIEDNFKDWDEDYNDTDEKKNIYSRMYNTDFEDHPVLGDKYIKPTSI